MENPHCFKGVVGWVAARYSLLDFFTVYGFPNNMSDIEYWEDCLPKFYGNDQITFQDIIDDLWVEP